MNPLRISLGNVEVGEGLPCLVIAEIGLNHNGNLKLAHQLIDAAFFSGASMVKFQKRSPSDLAIAEFLDAPFLKCPLFGKTQRDVRNRLELNIDQLRELKDHALSLGLMFSSSVFDIKSLNDCLKVGIDVIKVASHSITNAILLREIANTKLPVVASLGASRWEERDKAVEILSNNPLALLHCVSSYPTADSLTKLDTIPEIRRRYGKVVGFSGHDDGIDLSIAAVTLGASLLERHITINMSMVGLDHLISLEPDEFSKMVRIIRRVEKARGVMDGILIEEQPTRRNYHVAICAKNEIDSGKIISQEDIVCKQPLTNEDQFFTGLELEKVIGRRTKTKLSADKPIPRNSIE